MAQLGWVLGAAALGAGVAMLCGQARDFAGKAAGEARTVLGVELRWCPRGEFRMGSPASEVERRADEEAVRTTISQGFWMGRYEVTQEQWSRISGSFPQAMDFGAGADFPVYWVNYPEAEDFCVRLSRKAWEAGELDRGWEFRLPTEAQWEYACRAGSGAATAFGDQLSRKDANFSGTPYNGGADGPAAGRAVPVGSYRGNAWGIHDMHGNVFEWTRDWYHTRLPGGVDPDLSAEKGAMNRDGTYSRVRRGGAFNDPGWACRCAMRLRYEPERRSDHIGFRVAVVRLASPARP